MVRSQKKSFQEAKIVLKIDFPNISKASYRSCEISHSPGMQQDASSQREPQPLIVRTM